MHAYALINSLTAGLNIQIPGQPPVQTIPGTIIPQPLKLPGEIRRINYQNNDLITNSYTYIQKSTFFEENKDKNLSIKNITF